ncbi:hypothetical protein ACJJTC_017817, partial [Scirpophaga incertulas]
RLELNTTCISQTVIYITISPCSDDFQWTLYRKSRVQDPLMLLKDHAGGEMRTFSIYVTHYDRYILQLSSSEASSEGGAAAVSVRGEVTKGVRLRVRIRSKRKLITNWDPSPIDPQSTTYCIVISHSKNYTSLCAAQTDAKKRLENNSMKTLIEDNRFDIDNSKIDCSGAHVDNKIETDPFAFFEGNFRSIYRRKKFARSTMAGEDPVIACMDRTHHLIENLDLAKTYYVSVFGIASDRQSGSLLATGTVKPRTSSAKRLKENTPVRADIRGKTVYYFKATVGTDGGLWTAISACGGVVDVEVLVRGKRLTVVKNIESHSKFFVPTPILRSSAQETSDEGSVQFDSSSEEARVRYVIKVSPSKWDVDRSITVEVAVSTTRWGLNMPELSEDGSTVRELRPKRSCRSLDIAFLPASYNNTNIIRYCVFVRDTAMRDTCTPSRKYSVKSHCFYIGQRKETKVIMQRINGLKPGRTYAIQVTASTKGSTVPYELLYANTNESCR